MSKLSLLILVFFLQASVWGQSPSSELNEIILELEENNKQQEMLLEQQEKTIQELKNLNEEKQALLNQQDVTISLLKNLIEDQENSLKKQKTYWILTSIGAGFVGFGIGGLVFHLGS